MLGLSKMRDNQRVLIKNPPAGTPVEQGDYVIVMSNGKAKVGLRKVFQTVEGRF